MGLEWCATHEDPERRKAYRASLDEEHRDLFDRIGEMELDADVWAAARRSLSYRWSAFMVDATEINGASQHTRQGSFFFLIFFPIEIVIYYYSCILTVPPVFSPFSFVSISLDRPLSLFSCSRLVPPSLPPSPPHPSFDHPSRDNRPAFFTPLLPHSIFVHEGLVAACDNDDELAHVLGHEMSHMVCGHIEIMLQFSAILQLVQMVLLAMLDPTGTLSFAGEIAMWWGNKLGAFCLHTHACVRGSHGTTLVHSSPLVTRHAPPTC